MRTGDGIGQIVDLFVRKAVVLHELLHIDGRTALRIKGIANGQKGGPDDSPGIKGRRMTLVFVSWDAISNTVVNPHRVSICVSSCVSSASECFSALSSGGVIKSRGLLKTPPGRSAPAHR